MTRGALACCLAACVASGCYRAVYRNFEPPEAVGAPAPAIRRSSAWRSFFLYGWLPREVVVHAAAECGGAANVREIRTRRSFRQGLVHFFASSGVNVYSPWTGEVVCGEDAAARDAPTARGGGEAQGDRR